MDITGACKSVVRGLFLCLEVCWWMAGEVADGGSVMWQWRRPG
jgi:hypothetical protein